MIPKLQAMKKAIELRRAGFTYSEILKQVPVAKSSISLWLRSVKLAKQQKQRLTEKRRLASLRGGRARKTQRLTRTRNIIEAAKKEVGDISRHELQLIGAALYWAEGSKQKEHNPGVRLQFTNSDPLMIQVYLRWLRDIFHVDPQNVKYEIYIHETAKYHLERIRRFWAETTNNNINVFTTVYFKKSHIKTNRKNVGSLYNGQLRITVRASSELNRRVSGWVQGIVENLV